MRWLLAIVSMVACGCRYTGTYACEHDDQCRSRAAPGTCQRPAGVCSFPDPTCPLGQRYDDTAGDLAGECVENPLMIDASIPFDPSGCPSTFTAIHASIPSRYRVLPALTAADEFPVYMAACEAQKPGFTHGVVLDSLAEATAIVMVIGSNAGQHYIGAVQSPAAAMPGDSWINADGSPLVASLWSAAQTEPDDSNADEADHAEQAGAFNADGIFDVPGDAQLPVICECDGKAVSPMFQELLTANRWD